MNIDLIRKYKAEFEWWLENQDKNVQTRIDGRWRTRKDPFGDCWGKEIEAIVINDEYAKFRMAEADGKEILITDEWSNTGHPIKNGNGKIDFKFPVCDYSIKPTPKPRYTTDELIELYKIGPNDPLSFIAWLKGREGEC